MREQKTEQVASRELDALVATKVMGWRVGADGRFIGPGRAWRPNWKFSPSTDMVAAMLVVYRVRHVVDYQRQTQTYSFELCQTGIPGNWYCSFTTNQRDWSHQARIEHVDTAPLAICLAALRAIEAPAGE